MNRIFSALIVLTLCATTFTGCDSNTPKGVANKWLTHFYHMEYGEAKKYSTEETQNMLGMLEQYAAVVADSQKANAKKVKVEITNVKEEGDNAVVNYVLSDDNQEKSVHLVKKEGKWLVHYTKQDKLEEEGTEDINDDAVIQEGEEGTESTETTTADSTNM